MGGWVWVVTIKYNAKSVQLNLPTQIELSKNKIAKLSSSWLVKPSSVELSLALILVITPHPHPPTPGESIFEPLLDYLGS